MQLCATNRQRLIMQRLMKIGVFEYWKHPQLSLHLTPNTSITSPFYARTSSHN